MGIDPVSLTMMAVAGLGSAVASQVLAPKQPQIAAPPPPPQASKAPDANAVRAGMAGTGQGGGSPGVAQTFLSGVQGVDPSLLTLGKNTLLGGG